MLFRRKAHLLHHPAEQCTKSRHCNNKLHQIAYRKFKNPITNYRVKQQPFHSPPKKEIHKVVRDMVLAWVLTFPGCGVIGYGMAKLLIVWLG